MILDNILADLQEAPQHPATLDSFVPRVRAAVLEEATQDELYGELARRGHLVLERPDSDPVERFEVVVVAAGLCCATRQWSLILHGDPEALAPVEIGTRAVLEVRR